MFILSRMRGHENYVMFEVNNCIPVYSLEYNIATGIT